MRPLGRRRARRRAVRDAKRRALEALDWSVAAADAADAALAAGAPVDGPEVAELRAAQRAAIEALSDYYAQAAGA